jgi:hypothetical protein
MEKQKISNLDILLAITGFNKALIKNEVLEEVKVIASKINKNFIFKQLEIDEDIKCLCKQFINQIYCPFLSNKIRRSSY